MPDLNQFTGGGSSGGGGGFGLNPLSLGIMGAKMIGGAIQAFKGGKILRNTKLPDYNIAPEFEANVGLARDLKNMGGMPQTQYTQALQNMFRNANFGMGQLQGRRGAVAGVGNMVQRLNDGSTNLAVQDASLSLQNKRIGTGMQMLANSRLGQERNAKQSWEKFNPYLRRLNEGQALVGAGMQNMFGAASDVTSMAMYDNYFKKQ